MRKCKYDNGDYFRLKLSVLRFIKHLLMSSQAKQSIAIGYVMSMNVFLNKICNKTKKINILIIASPSCFLDIYFNI